jgi:hypothetical protein
MPNYTANPEDLSHLIKIHNQLGQAMEEGKFASITVYMRNGGSLSGRLGGINLSNNGANKMDSRRYCGSVKIESDLGGGPFSADIDFLTIDRIGW